MKINQLILMNPKFDVLQYSSENEKTNEEIISLFQN